MLGPRDTTLQSSPRERAFIVVLPTLIIYHYRTDVAGSLESTPNSFIRVYIKYDSFTKNTFLLLLLLLLLLLDIYIIYRGLHYAKYLMGPQ